MVGKQPRQEILRSSLRPVHFLSRWENNPNILAISDKSDTVSRKMEAILLEAGVKEEVSDERGRV